jgi:protein tyrosine phosphatase (PTP) superfamily phosphohydrolase (DUF442 family)
MPWCFGEVKPGGVLFFPPLSEEREETKMVPNITEPEKSNGVPMIRVLHRTLLVFLLLAFEGCQARSPTSSASNSSSEPPAGDAKIEVPGLHNVHRITDQLYSGSSPEGEAGFRSLKGLGIKTIISVDGARPDVTTAHKFDLRYAHIPFGYDGIPRDQILRLAKAVHELPGPVYIHCHHGKHRGPTAAAAVHLCLDPKCSVEQALEEMRRAGTDPHYTGLYAVPRNLVRPTPKDLALVPGDFPEVAKVPGLAQIMVEIDSRWENMKLIRAAGWEVPVDHPDLDPPHEALQLAEHFREANRLKEVDKRPTQFREWLAECGRKMTKLEHVLRIDKESGKRDRLAADEAFKQMDACCVQCHANYRDVPQTR